MNVLFKLLFGAVVIITNVSHAELRDFTNKEGQTIEAEILSVAADWSKVMMQGNNQEFVLTPNLLILDDQQFIKDWLVENGSLKPNREPGAQPIKAALVNPPSNPDDMRIDIRSRTSKSTGSRVRNDYETLESKEVAYEIDVVNLSSSTVYDLLVEYALVMDNKINTPNSKNALGLKAYKGKRRIKELIYNRKNTIVTRALDVDFRKYDYSEYNTEDKVLGLIVRIKADGKVVQTYRDADGERSDLDWDEVEKLGSGSSFNVPNDGPFTLNLVKGDFVDKKLPVQARSIEISAASVHPKPNSGGVIAEIGGKKTGLSLFVKDRKIVLSVRNPKVGVKSIETPLPLGEFDVIASLNESGLSLVTGKGRPVFRDDITFLAKNPDEGITIGSAGGYHVDDYGSDGDFLGQIGKVTFKVSK